jgi:hypothetical protein
VEGHPPCGAAEDGADVVADHRVADGTRCSCTMWPKRWGAAKPAQAQVHEREIQIEKNWDIFPQNLCFVGVVAD